MSAPRDPARTSWPPWWAYVAPILILNYLRQLLVPPADVGDAANVALFLGVTVAVAVLVTILYRLLSRADG